MVDKTREGWEKLAVEIVKVACGDYLKALKKNDEYKIIALEKWFKGEYCYSLCGVEGDVIIEELRKAHAEKTYNHKNMGGLIAKLCKTLQKIAKLCKTLQNNIILFCDIVILIKYEKH